MFENIKLYFKIKKTIKNIINIIIQKENFLILGHINPDEDSISSMSAMAIIINKFNKNACIYLGSEIHEHFQFLLNICSYNGIKVIREASDIKGDFDVVIVCDTAKKDMIDSNDTIDSYLNNDDILKVEIDHHLGADSEIIGDEGYSLKVEASSASELVGMIALELKKDKKLLNKYNISDPVSRNISLAVLTGIIGDSKMGKYLKSKREQKYYNIFTELYNKKLLKETNNEANFSDMGEVFQEIQRLSSNENSCYKYIMCKKKFSKSIGYALLAERDMNYLIYQYGIETIREMSRTATDSLAEESKKIGLVVYYDDPKKSDLVQFRMRRSNAFKELDLREFLKLFSIENGGGHEGAIGFRVPKDEIYDINEYIEKVISFVELMIPKKVTIIN
jgi:nanoRNase/pAp phosphatase (c-di-AMP/oligoRNAs hydrolase)